MNVDRLLTALLHDLDAQRVTLRLDVPGMNFPAVAEVAAAGVATIAHDNSLDQRGAATAQWIMRHRRVLAQPDVCAGEPRPPRALIETYGVGAQMLGPIVVDDDAVVGWISVHADHPRPWRKAEVAALQRAMADVAINISRLRPMLVARVSARGSSVPPSSASHPCDA